MAKKSAKTTEQVAETNNVAMVEKNALAEVERLKQRIIQKDKEYVALEQVYEDKNGHLQFMVNALTGDKQRLEAKVDELQFKCVHLNEENKYLAEKLDGKGFSFKERVRILFTGKAR